MDPRTTYLFKITLTFLLSLLITLLLIMPAKATAGVDEQLQTDSPYRVESFTLADTGSLNVRTSGGHITVEGSSSNSVRVEMYVRQNGRELSPDETSLDGWEIDISQSGQTINAIAENKGNRRGFFGNSNQPSISFVVYTPREMSSDLNTSGGHISVSGINGMQEMRTSGGHIELSALQGNIKARTSGGSIDVSDLQGNLDIQTSGGHISITNVSAEVVKAKTSGGNVTADFIAIGSSADLRTSGGNINITVPQDTGFSLDIKGSYVNSNNLKNFSGRTERDEIEGEINGGGPSVSARTSGGMVSFGFN